MKKPENLRKSLQNMKGHAPDVGNPLSAPEFKALSVMGGDEFELKVVNDLDFDPDGQLHLRLNFPSGITLRQIHELYSGARESRDSDRVDGPLVKAFKAFGVEIQTDPAEVFPDTTSSCPIIERVNGKDTAKRLLKPDELKVVQKATDAISAKVQQEYQAAQREAGM